MDHPCLYDVASIIYGVVNVLSWFYTETYEMNLIVSRMKHK